MGKIRGLVILIILLWVSGGIGYRAASGEKLRASLARQYGPGVVVEKVTYHDTYGLNSFRQGEATFSIPAPKADPRSPRGFAAQMFAVPVESRGRFWPGELRHGYPKVIQSASAPP